jgi:hypothetical protein
MFIPEQDREKACRKLSGALAAEAGKTGKRKLDFGMIHDSVSLVIPEQYRGMVSYFIGLAGRVT